MSNSSCLEGLGCCKEKISEETNSSNASETKPENHTEQNPPTSNVCRARYRRKVSESDACDTKKSCSCHCCCYQSNQERCDCCRPVEKVETERKSALHCNEKKKNEQNSQHRTDNGEMINSNQSKESQRINSTKCTQSKLKSSVKKVIVSKVIQKRGKNTTSVHRSISVKKTETKTESISSSFRDLYELVEAGNWLEFEKKLTVACKKNKSFDLYPELGAQSVLKGEDTILHNIVWASKDNPRMMEAYKQV